MRYLYYIVIRQVHGFAKAVRPGDRDTRGDGYSLLAVDRYPYAVRGDIVGRSRKDDVMIDRDSPVALHRQIADDLAAALAGHYHPGERLPTESALMIKYGVSRITVRQALATLTVRGLLVRRQGKGTFVAERAPRGEARQSGGFVDILTAQGLEPETRLLDFAERRADPQIVARLGLTGDHALTFRRQYLLDGRPLALTEVWLPPAVALLLDREAAERLSSHALLTERAGLAIGHAELAIRTTALRDDLAAQLSLPNGSAALVEERLTYCTAGVPREHSTLYLHPDACELQLTIEPGQALAHAVRAPHRAH
jgi:GntR family transcriptional regulator